jgi:hypothetical protein
MDELEFLASTKAYIERMEYESDWERGDCRPIPQLISDGEMPQPIYSELIRRIEALAPTTKAAAALAQPELRGQEDRE